MPLFLVLWLDFYEMILTKVADHADAVWVILWLLFCFNACELNIWPNGIWKCDNHVNENAQRKQNNFNKEHNRSTTFQKPFFCDCLYLASNKYLLVFVATVCQHCPLSTGYWITHVCWFGMSIQRINLWIFQ